MTLLGFHFAIATCRICSYFFLGSEMNNVIVVHIVFG